MVLRIAATIGAVSLVLAHAVASVACTRQSVLPSAEAAALAGLPIHLDKPLGADLQLVGLSVTAQPDRSWIVTLHSRVLHAGNPRSSLWVHAYPQESAEYFTLDPAGISPSAVAGHVVMHGFRLTRAGAFNLYAGVTDSAGNLGPAVGLGWVGVGVPDTPDYHRAYRFLQEADDTRAAVMMQQAQHDYPRARLP